jgi:hypothetical protein
MAEFSLQVVMMTLQLFPMCFNVFTPEFNHLQQGQAGIPDPLRGGAWVHF